MKLRIVCGVLVLLGATLGRGGEEAAESVLGEAGAGPIRLGLVDVASWVRRENPQLKASRWLVEEARARLNGAGKWRNPSLSTQYGGNSNGFESMASVGLKQAIPITRRLQWERAVSKAQVAAAAAEVAELERQLIAGAKRLAVVFLSSLAEEELRTRQLAIARELNQFVSELAARGEASILEVGQAEIRVVELGLEVHHLSHERRRLEGKLKTALGLSPEHDWEIIGGLPEPRSAADGPIEPELEHRPDLLLMRQEVKAVENELGLERARRWQDVTVGVFAQLAREEDLPIGVETERSLGLQLSIPLPLWQRNEGAIDEKVAKGQRLKESVRAKTNEIRNEVLSSRVVMNTLAGHANEVRTELLPGAKRHVGRMERAYREGQLDLQALLQARHQSAELEAKYLESIKDYHLARVDYEAAIGQFEEGAE